MKTKRLVVMATMVLAMGGVVMSQSPGPVYTVSVRWDRYEDADKAAGFRIKVAPVDVDYGAPGSSMYVVSNSLATNFVLQVSPGADYKLTMTAFSPYGLESAPSAEVRWSAPSSLPSPTGLKPTAIIYIP